MSDAPKLRIFELGSDRHLHPIVDEKPSPDWLHDETVRWVVCVNIETEEVETVCESCGVELPPQISKTLRNPPPHPTVVGLEKLLFIRYVVFGGGTGTSVSAVCAPSTILTFHESSEMIDEVIRDCQHQRRIRAQVPLAVLFELIDAGLKRLAGRALRLRRKLVALTDEVELGSKHLDPEEHLALKHDATALEIQFEDYLQVVAEMAKFESDSVEAKLFRPLMLQLQADLVRGLEAVVRLKSRINDLHQFQVREADETTNRRLKVLTILSAIYLPATLIAGIYGMNFNNIPIMSVPFGYFIVMGIMAVVVIGQLVLFYKRGWFK